MPKFMILVLLIFWTSALLMAQEKTFIREYTYNASELDSRVSSRAIAINELRSDLLNELGVYVENESTLKTTEVGGKFSQDFVENIVTLSAGVTRLEVLNETWNGETFWIKASITVDEKSLEESLKELIADRRKAKDLEEIRNKLGDAMKEIERLKNELTATRNSNYIKEISEQYNNEIKQLNSGDFLLNGIGYFEQSDYHQAIENYTKSIELTPEFALAFLYRGLAKNKLGDMSGTLVDLTTAIELNPNNGFAYYSRGVTKSMVEDYKGAVMDFNRAIDTDQQWISAYYYRGLSKRYLEDYTGAINDQAKVIQLDSKFVLAYIDTGLIRTILGEYRDAAEILSKAIELDPNSADAFYLRGLAKSYGQLRGGCLDLRKSLDLGYRKAYDAMIRFCN